MKSVFLSAGASSRDPKRLTIMQRPASLDLRGERRPLSIELVSSPMTASLQRLLDDPVKGAAFRDYMHQHQCDEGLLFLDDYAAMLGVVDSRNRRAAAHAIVKQFVSLDATPVSISSATRETIIMAALKDDVALPALLERVFVEVARDLRGSDGFQKCS